MRFIHDDDDVFKSDVHGFETRLTNAVVKEVIVISNKDVSTADRFFGCFPRAGLSGFTVGGMGPCDLNQFIDVERRGENALFEAGR